MLSLLTCALALLPSLLPSNLRHASVQPRRTTAPSMLRDVYDLVVVGGGPVGITAALRGAALGYDTILIDATPPRQFQFTGPTGLYSKALRDSAIRLDVPVLRAMGISDKAIWAQPVLWDVVEAVVVFVALNWVGEVAVPLRTSEV